MRGKVIMEDEKKAYVVLKDGLYEIGRWNKGDTILLTEKRAKELGPKRIKLAKKKVKEVLKSVVNKFNKKPEMHKSMQDSEEVKTKAKTKLKKKRKLKKKKGK
jgi:hypothetical protein